MFVEFSIYFSIFFDCLSPIEVVGHAFHSSAFGVIVLPKLIHFMIQRLNNPYRITLALHATIICNNGSSATKWI